MASAAGTVLALILLLLLGAGLWLSWRRPVVGLGLLVAGMAFHSFLLMIVLALGTPLPLVRVFQAWKEILLALLTIVAVLGLWRDWRAGKVGRLTPTDWVAAAFAALAVIYLLVPSSLLHSDVNLTQRVLGFRVVALIPLLYFLGRRLWTTSSRDLSPALWLCLGAGAFVALFGLVEMWLIPTRDWLDWGVNLYTGFLGFTYTGPAGLPENFFLTLPNDALVRRMVSIYISPLPIAYTGLLLFPLGVALVERRPQRPAVRWLAIALLVLMLAGVMFSETRLAIFVTVLEAALLALLLRSRWLIALVPVVTAAAAFMILAYPSVAPVVDRNLLSTRAGQGQPAISTNDVSTTEHFSQIVLDLKIDLQHPLGLGVGASTNRFGKLVGTGESAVLGMFGDLGILGGLLYVALYLATLWNAFRAYRLAPPHSLQMALPLTALVGGLALVPITLTSDLWGDLSVTYLFWWAAGTSAALASRAVGVRESSKRPADAAKTTVRAT
jgi:O-antigen ligase